MTPEFSRFLARERAYSSFDALLPGAGWHLTKVVLKNFCEARPMNRHNKPMQKRFVIAAIAALLSVPLAVTAAEKKKGGGFTAADTNNDGKVDQTEYVAFVKASKSGADKKDSEIKARFKDLDKDGNGSLSQEEFSAGMKKKKS